MLKVIYILTFTLMCFANFHSFAQQLLKFNSEEIPSTSFYDIYALNSNRYILAAKNGIIAESDTSGNIKILKISTNSANFLKSEKINDSLLMIIGDQGRINILNIYTNEIEDKCLSKFQNKALYNTCVDNKRNIYINGGHSKIACGQKAVPNGFILKSNNGGKSWEKIYGRKFKMVWDIKFNSADQKLYAIVYSPFGSKLIASENEGKSWKTVLKSEKKDLFHSLYLSPEGTIFISGGNYKQNGGKGAIYEVYGNNYKKHTCSFFVWDIVSTPNIDIASCSKGWIVYRIKTSNNENWYELNSTADYNLYEIEKISENSFLLGGSRKTLIRFNLDATETTLKK